MTYWLLPCLYYYSLTQVCTAFDVLRPLQMGQGDITLLLLYCVSSCIAHRKIHIQRLISWTYSPCYSQSPLLQLCLEMSISSKSRNLLQFLQFSYCTLERIKEEKLTENHTPFPMVFEIHTETSSLKTLKIIPRNLNEIVRSWIWLLVTLYRMVQYVEKMVWTPGEAVSLPSRPPSPPCNHSPRPLTPCNHSPRSPFSVPNISHISSKYPHYTRLFPLLSFRREHVS